MADLRLLFFLASSFLVLSACKSDADKAQKVVDEALKAHGTEQLEQDSIRFVFRDHRFLHYRKKGRFRYERWPRETDSADVPYHDVLTNEGFTRYRNGEPVELSAEERSKYKEALNSVVYFAFLPYRLNDPAVIKSYRGKETIKGTPYHRVRVTFQKEGGGKDHEDIFLYWFNVKTKRLDFFAYRYYRDGGGIRFREAYNKRKIGGTLFQDYRNYKAEKSTELERLDELWAKDSLEQVSLIRTEEIEWQ